MVAAAALVAGAPVPAAADNGMGQIAEGIIGLGFVSELLIPDLRLVIGADDHLFALSWPIVLASVKVVRGDAVGLGLHPFVEPQWQPTREALRLAGGARLLLFRPESEVQFAPLIEGGGLAGQDGSGWFAGGGLCLGVPELGIAFGLVARVNRTDEEDRFDLALDFQMPLTSDEY